MDLQTVDWVLLKKKRESKMKYVFLITLSILLGSCAKPGNDYTPVPLPQYSACEQLPSGTPAPQFNCPGADGTWNNYLVRTDGSGNVVTYELWCGGSTEDHPANQGDYDLLIPPGNTTNSDYVVTSDCASGSSVDTSSGAETINIWQRQP